MTKVKNINWDKNKFVTNCWKKSKKSFFYNNEDNINNSGQYYKNIMTIVSDDRKWSLNYKCVVVLTLALVLARVVYYDRKWCSKL
jgi:hypothetical protein